ncbi:MAG TPA: hypothetical protein VFM51_01720 [Solirubrobacterales bacterium]|nr:hypothetical protein [Solirubrobacterales bacterium]
MSGAGKPSDISKQQRALRATTAERLEAIVEAAERAAEGVIDDAEAQARRYLAQARADADRLAEGRISEFADLIDSLIAQVGSLREAAERLQAGLEEAKSRTGGESLEPAEGSEPSQAPLLRAVSEPEAPAALQPEIRSDAAGARLLATQMAVSGCSREEIEHRLRNGFEIEDTGAIVDAILGPED